MRSGRDIIAWYEGSMKGFTVLYIVALLVMVAGTTASGQSFTFVADDTLLSAQLGSEIVFNATVTNTSSSTITLMFVRTVNSLPQGWESSMCLDVCYPSTTDSVVTLPAFGSSPLNPGESRPFSVHVYTATTNGTGTIRIHVGDTRNLWDTLSATFVASTLSSQVAGRSERPIVFSLSQNYPNPFNPATNIAFAIPAAGKVILRVFDISGKEVATLVNERLAAGSYVMTFDAKGLASGVYLCRLDWDAFTSVRRLALIK